MLRTTLDHAKITIEYCGPSSLYVASLCGEVGIIRLRRYEEKQSVPPLVLGWHVRRRHGL